jgi:hypothetical protein
MLTFRSQLRDPSGSINDSPGFSGRIASRATNNSSPHPVDRDVPQCRCYPRPSSFSSGGFSPFADLPYSYTLFRVCCPTARCWSASRVVCFPVSHVIRLVSHFCISYLGCLRGRPGFVASKLARRSPWLLGDVNLPQREVRCRENPNVEMCH